MTRRFAPTTGGSAAGVVLMVPALLLIGLLYIVPLIHLAAMSIGEHGAPFAGYVELFDTWSYTDTLIRTFRVSTCVALVCLVFGYPLGYVMALATPRLRAVLALLVLLPFWSSVLVRNFAWVYILRDGGFFSVAAGVLTGSGEPARLIYNEVGVVVAMSSSLLPFMIFPVFLAIAFQDRSAREAAASLGASPARVFLSVTLPLSRTGVYAGTLLVFAIALGFFITPALLGGGRVLLAATFLSQQVEDFVNWSLAAAAGIVLLALVLVMAFVYGRVTGTYMFGVNREST